MGRMAATFRIALQEVGHLQQPTVVVNDSTTGDSLENDNIRQCISGVNGVCLYWVRYWVRQGHSLVYWASLKDNLADYFTKHHPTKHHWATISVAIYCPLIPDWIGSTQAQIFSDPIQNGDTEPNSKYCLKEYFNILQSNAVTLFIFFYFKCILGLYY